MLFGRKVPTEMCVGSWAWSLVETSIVALLTEYTKGGTLLRTKRVGVSSSLEEAVLARATFMPRRRVSKQQSILEAQAEVNKATQEYETKVLTQCAEEAHHGVESVLQALGIQEDALTEAQQRSLAALKKDTADEAKRRKTQQQHFPPGLAPQLCPEPPAAEVARAAEGTKGPLDQSAKARSRSPKRASDKGEEF